MSYSYVPESAAECRLLQEESFPILRVPAGFRRVVVMICHAGLGASSVLTGREPRPEFSRETPRVGPEQLRLCCIQPLRRRRRTEKIRVSSAFECHGMRRHMDSDILRSSSGSRRSGRLPVARTQTFENSKKFLKRIDSELTASNLPAGISTRGLQRLPRESRHSVSPHLASGAFTKRRPKRLS